MEGGQGESGVEAIAYGHDPIEPAGLRPRIGYDASSVVGPRTGIGFAAAELLAALGRHWPESWPNLMAWVNSPRHPIPTDDDWRAAANIDLHHTRYPGKALLRGWQHLGWPMIERFVGEINLVHSPASYIIPTRAARRILTIHDIYFKYEPGHVEPYGGGYFLKTFERGLARLDKIIAVSQFTRGELLTQYGLDPELVTYIPLGINTERFHPRAEPGDVERLESAGVSRPYLLCIATAEPRKNLVTLIEAYARARHIMMAGKQRLPRLVIAGQPGWGRAGLIKRVEEAGVGEDVVLTGYVDDATVTALYRGALGFVFPSIYEGFGMPVLEAMACGCPVALARTSSLPEVGADAAAYFNPRNSDSMARVLADFVADPIKRQTLRERGHERVKAYSWDATARATIELYKQVLTSPIRRAARSR